MSDDREKWAEDHGYTRINCRIHGRSWSDTGRCEQCTESADIPAAPLDVEDEN